MESDSHTRVEHALRAALQGVQASMAIPHTTWDNVFTLCNERTGKLILSGVGKSGYIAMKVASTLTSLGQPAVFVHPIEAMHGDSGALQNGDVLIAFSFSGNTKELVHFIEHVKVHFKVKVIGVTKHSDSRLGKLSDVVIPVTIEEEGCPLNLAPMASTTASLVIGDAIAAGLTSPHTFTESDFARFHPSGTLGLMLTPVGERVSLRNDVAVRHTESLQEVLKKMGMIGKGLIAVVGEKGELMGSITDGDVRRFFAEHLTVEGKEASHAMSRSPKCILPTQSLKEALQLMEEHSITNLFVVDEKNIPIGIIHMHDIVHIS